MTDFQILDMFRIPLSRGATYDELCAIAAESGVVMDLTKHMTAMMRYKWVKKKANRFRLTKNAPVICIVTKNRVGAIVPCCYPGGNAQDCNVCAIPGRWCDRNSRGVWKRRL